jgi:hypothetical protein
MPDTKTVFCKSKLVWIRGDNRFVTEDQCRYCQTRFDEHSTEQILDDPNLNPSFIQRFKNFIKASAKQAIRGYKVEKEFSDLREKVCEACPVYDRSLKYCTDRRCGCKASLLSDGMKTKWEWSTSACPKALWKPTIKNQTIQSYTDSCIDPKTGKPFSV